MEANVRESKLESEFQTALIEELEQLFPGCLVLVKPGFYIQGFPDLMILYKNKWAALEVKARWNSIHQPNQDWYVDMLDDMSFGAFIFPENKEEVLNELQHAFAPRRKARLSQRE